MKLIDRFGCGSRPSMRSSGDAQLGEPKQNARVVVSDRKSIPSNNLRYRAGSTFFAFLIRLRDCIQLGCCLSRSIRAALRPRPRGCRTLFSSQDDHVAATEKPTQNRRAPSVGGSLRVRPRAQPACHPRLRQSAVRNAGVRKPILVLTSFWPGEETNLLKYDLTPVIHRCEQLKALDRAAAKRSPRKPVSFHLKIDTGMNRLGIATSDVECFAGRLVKCKHLRLGGVMTHFASSEAFAPSPQGQQTLEQERNFYAALDHLRKLGIDTGIVHMANSAAIAARPER